VAGRRQRFRAGSAAIPDTASGDPAVGRCAAAAQRGDGQSQDPFGAVLSRRIQVAGGALGRGTAAGWPAG